LHRACRRAPPGARPSAGMSNLHATVPGTVVAAQGRDTREVNPCE
jgi:hypothetical protein